MLTVFLVSLLFIASAVYYFVKATINGLNRRVWLVVGLILGPVALPMFAIQSHIEWRKSVGFNNIYLRV